MSIDIPVRPGTSAYTRTSGHVSVVLELPMKQLLKQIAVRKGYSVSALGAMLLTACINEYVADHPEEFSVPD